MSDFQAGQEPEGNTPAAPTPEEQAPAAPAAEAEAQGGNTESAAGAVATPAADGEQGHEDGDKPDWKAKQEASANHEAAKYRVKLREVEGQLTERDTTITELQAKIAELEGVATTKTRAAVAAAYGLPDALAAVLAGNNEEELRAHAETLSAFAGGTNPRRAHFRSAEGVGGLDPLDATGAVDVSGAVAAARAQRY